MTVGVRNANLGNTMRVSSRYRIGPDDRIVQVDEEFARFARDNGAADLAREALGSLLWEHLTGAGIEALYRQLLGRVREDERTIRVPFRCDAPDERRFMSLAIGPGETPGEIDFEAYLIRAECRDPVPLWDSTVLRDDESLLATCAWCKRVRLGEWIDAEDAVVRLRLFERTLVPALTHGICEECASRVDGLLKSG